MSNLSEEQLTILRAAKIAYEKTSLSESSEPQIIKVSARSGSGKTHMLSSIAKVLLPTSGMYLAYNKSIADESAKSGKFPKTIACRTTHSVAFGNIVKNLKLTVGSFKYKDIKENIPPEDKIVVVEIMEKFCLSSATDIQDFVKDYTKRHVDLAQEYLRKMQTKKIPCTHSFYLKLYQLSLKAGIIKPKKVDLLMLDEAGDINEVTLSIFMMLPARLKIMVGDNHQNIYSFNGTINGFEALKDVGQYFELTQSFRVAAGIAKGIEAFCKEYLDPNVKFVGVEYKHSETEINSNAYISRSNGSMIARMIEMDQRRVPYNLVRKAKVIFELPLVLIYLRPGGTIHNEKYKILQKEADQWGADATLQHDYPTLFKYIAEVNKDDVEISGAVALMARFGIDTIMETYASALKHEEDTRKHFTTLCTSHSSKG